MNKIFNDLMFGGRQIQSFVDMSKFDPENPQWPSTLLENTKTKEWIDKFDNYKNTNDVEEWLIMLRIIASSNDIEIY